MSRAADIPGAFHAWSAPQRTWRRRYGWGFLAALAVHAGVIFLWPGARPGFEAAQFGMAAGETSLEVALVAAPPAAEVEPPAPLPPPPVEAPPPEPVPVPEKAPEMTRPTAEPVLPATPPPVARPRPAKPAAPAPAARRPGAVSSAGAGSDSATTSARAGAVTTKPSYWRNPNPAYPEAARSAGQQGTVLLRVRLDEKGRVASAVVAQSSGFPLLDERARSTVAGQWSFRPALAGGVPVAAEVIVPVRFTLER